MSTQLAYTQEADFHITQACSAHCGFCYVDPRKDLPCRKIFDSQPRYGDKAKLLEIIDALRNVAGANDLVLVGGDPCEHPDIVSLLRHAKEIGFDTCVLSNTHIYHDGGRVVPVRDVVPYVSEMDFTLHGTPEVHDAFNGVRGSCRSAMDQLREFMLYRTDQPVGIVLNMTPDTIRYLRQTAKYVIDELNLVPGLDFFTIQRIAPTGKARESYKKWSLTPNRVNMAFETFEDIRGKYGIQTKVCIDALPWCAVPHQYWDYLEPLTGGCNWGKPGGVISVLMDGELQRCALCESTLGVNILDIPNREAYDDFLTNNPILRAFNEKRHLDDHCLECSYLEKCGGACVIACGVEHGDPYANGVPTQRSHDYLAV